MKKAVWQKAAEELARMAESIDLNELDEETKDSHIRTLDEAQQDALAAAFGVFPGMPEYEEWKRGGAAK